MSSDRIPFHQAVTTMSAILDPAVAAIQTSVTDSNLSMWGKDETVAVVAMGASSNSGHAFVAAMKDRGRRALNLTAADFISAPAFYDPAEHYLLVSESGRSPEPINAARTRGAGRRIGITNFPDAALSEVADATIGYGGVDDSHVYTSGYLATLLSYAALLDAVGPGSGFDVTSTTSLVASATEQHDAAAKGAATLFRDARAVDLIGRGMSYASASQGALLAREALRYPGQAWETYQYIHGPLESMAKGSLLIVLGDGREHEVVEQFGAAGTNVVHLTAAQRVEAPNVTTITLKNSEGFARAIEETVVLQLITNAVAQDQSIDIEQFLYSQPDTKLPKPGGED